MSRIVVNYCKDIVDNYSGYLTGKDITYTSTEDISNIQDILNYNDVSAEDKDLLLNALIHGIAYEQCWIDEDGQQRFATLDPCEVIPVYYNDLEQKLACVIRYYNLSNTTDGLNNTRIEVYYDDRVEIYTSGPSFASLELIEVLPNYYNQIPITVLPLNKNHESIFAQIISLQDAYNDLISSEADNWSSFVDAYLVIEGMNADEEDIAMMKENRVLLTPDGGKVSYLTKNVNETQIDFLLNKIDYNIHKISNCPDFSADAFATSSGIALKMKLLGMENNASAIAKSMVKAIQKRLELICSILSKTDNAIQWRDIQIIIDRNLPIDLVDIANEINAYRGLVSDKTLLSQVPFVQDIDAELELLADQKAEQLAMYSSFSFGEDNDEQ